MKGDDYERESLRKLIAIHLAEADTAHAEGRLTDAGEHVTAAFELHKALRRLEKAVWYAALLETNSKGGST